MTGAIGPPGGHPAAYDVLIAFHVVLVVVGFGSVALSGVYGAIGRHVGSARQRAEAMPDLRRFFATDSKLGFALVGGPAFGVAAMAVRPGGSEWSELWAVVGSALWLAASALFVLVVRPGERRIQAALAAPPGDEQHRAGPELGAACRRLMWAAAASDVIFVIALFLMVTQPT